MSLVEQLENTFKYYPLLRFKGLYRKEIPDNIPDFIYKMFYEYNIEYDTVDKNEDVVAEAGQLRSLHDIYAICRYYYENVGFEDVCRAIFDLCCEKKLHGKWKCKQINRYVFSKNKTPYDESSVRHEKIDDKCGITIKQLYEELGYEPEQFKR